MRGSAIVLLLSLGFAHPPSAAKAQPPTTAHAVLELEAEIFPAPEPRRNLLDKIIRTATQTISKPAPTNSAEAARREALRTLTAIDRLLIEHDFIYPGEGLVQHLSEALTASRLSEDDLASALANHHNTRRNDSMLRNARGEFHVADCDLASFVYLAIGEAIGLPIGFVEVPDHNFVRWQLADGSHINFETMDGVEQSDAYYRAAYGVNPQHIGPGRHMVALTRNETLGYMQRLRGVWWKKRGQWDKARRDFDRAVQLRPTDPATHNSLAWLLATCPNASCRNGPLAVEIAKVAVKLDRSADHLDTLACAYAAAGDFRSAERHQLEAVAMSSATSLRENLEAIRAGQLCPADEIVAAPAPTALSAPRVEDLKPTERGNH